VISSDREISLFRHRPQTIVTNEPGALFPNRTPFSKISRRAAGGSSRRPAPRSGGNSPGGFSFSPRPFFRPIGPGARSDPETDWPIPNGFRPETRKRPGRIPVDLESTSNRLRIDSGTAPRVFGRLSPDFFGGAAAPPSFGVRFRIPPLGVSPLGSAFENSSLPAPGEPGAPPVPGFRDPRPHVTFNHFSRC
jgi:hypothetical protein